MWTGCRIRGRPTAARTVPALFRRGGAAEGGCHEPGDKKSAARSLWVGGSGSALALARAHVATGKRPDDVIDPHETVEDGGNGEDEVDGRRE